MTSWWSELYDDALADVLLESSSPAELAGTLRFLTTELALRPGDRVFDQCAGTGRLAIPLAQWGAEVVGVEQSARYVERARAHAVAAGVAVDLVAGDAFEHVPARPCAGAFNWWTGFGYLPDDAGNAVMLRRAFESIVPGGRFAIDYPNVPGLYAGFRAHEITRRDGILMLRDSRLELARGLLHKTWTFVMPDGRRLERPSTVKLYTPDRLAALLVEVGFEPPAIYGDLDRSPLELASPRCIAVAQRPA